MIVTCKTRKYCTFAETSTVACSTKVCIVCLFCFFAMANPANNTDTNTRCYPETLLLFTRWTMHLEKQPMLSLLRHWQQRHQCWKKRSRKRKKKCWNQWLWHKWLILRDWLGVKHQRNTVHLRVNSPKLLSGFFVIKQNVSYSTLHSRLVAPYSARGETAFVALLSSITMSQRSRKKQLGITRSLPTKRCHYFHQLFFWDLDQETLAESILLQSCIKWNISPLSSSDYIILYTI